MNKKLNTLIYVLIATVANMAVCFVLLSVLLLLIIYFVREEQIRAYLMIASFIAAIIGSSILYRRIASWFFDKFDLENKLDPLFTARHKKTSKE